MSRREPLLLVSDILESGRKILDYTAGMDFDSFTKDEKTIDAVIRNFQIIGEAANRLPDEFREQHSEVDWYRIRGFRNLGYRLHLGRCAWLHVHLKPMKINI